MVEVIGQFSGPMSEVVVRLLEKPAGGYRPIGLFSTVMRIWAKARCLLCKQWYKSRHVAALNLAPRRWASDPVWRTLVSWEAGQEDDIVAEVGTDVSKCYENVSHELLQAIGHRLGYPQTVLRVMLAAYRAGRTIVLAYVGGGKHGVPHERDSGRGFHSHD
jgi:hypothetical protein